MLHYHQPDNEDTFEQMCLRLYRKLWKNDSLSLYAKRGQQQHGVDIHDPLCRAPIRAVQCKHRDPTKELLADEIESEVRKAEGAPIPIEEYVIATTARKSKNAQNAVAILNRRPKAKQKFTVEVHFWEDICERLESLTRIQAEFVVRGQDLGLEFVGSMLQDSSLARTVAQMLAMKPELETETLG